MLLGHLAESQTLLRLRSLEKGLAAAIPAQELHYLALRTAHPSEPLCGILPRLHLKVVHLAEQPRPLMLLSLFHRLLIHPYVLVFHECQVQQPLFPEGRPGLFPVLQLLVVLLAELVQ